MGELQPVDVVAAVIRHRLRNDDRVLIVRRGPEQSGAGHWEFPGGKVEKGETPEQALVREIKEELNLDILVEGFITENTHCYPTKTIRLLVFHCSVTSDLELVLTEHDRLEWLQVESIVVEELSAADQPVLEFLKRQKAANK